MNVITIAGNLTRDPEPGVTQSDKPFCRMTVAVRRAWKTEGGPDADFLNVVVWGVAAQNCVRYLSKGSKVGVVGRVETHSYEDKEGAKRWATEIVADSVEFLSSKPQGAEE